MSSSNPRTRSSPRALLGGVLLWTLTVSVLHLAFNVRWDSVRNGLRPESERRLDVAYIPVT